jgi:hypothetical protein
MLVLLVLVASILIFRGLGFAGVSALASWPGAVRDGLAVMLLLTASAHFTPMKEDLIRMTLRGFQGRERWFSLRDFAR